MACATASPIAAAAAAGAAAPIAHASAAPPPLSKPSGTGKKSAKERAAVAGSTASSQYPLPTANGCSSRAAGSAAAASAVPHPFSVSEEATGAPLAKAKPTGSTGTKSSRNTVPAEEEAQTKPPDKKKFCPLTFIL